eukprot:EG_transcript_16794
MRPAEKTQPLDVLSRWVVYSSLLLVVSVLNQLFSHIPLQCFIPILYLGYSIWTGRDAFCVFRLVFFVECLFWSGLAYLCLKPQWLLLAMNSLLILNTLEWSRAAITLSLPIALLFVAIDSHQEAERSLGYWTVLVSHAVGFCATVLLNQHNLFAGVRTSVLLHCVNGIMLVVRGSLQYPLLLSLLKCCIALLRAVLLLLQLGGVWVRILSIWLIFFVFDYKWGISLGGIIFLLSFLIAFGVTLLTFLDQELPEGNPPASPDAPRAAGGWRTQVLFVVIVLILDSIIYTLIPHMWLPSIANVVLNAYLLVYYFRPPPAAKRRGKDKEKDKDKDKDKERDSTSLADAATQGLAPAAGRKKAGRPQRGPPRTAG